MSIPIRDTFIRSGTGNYPLLEDSDIKGGFRVVANVAALATIPTAMRTAGMYVYSIAEDCCYILGADLVTWVAGQSSIARNVITTSQNNTINKRYIRTTGSDTTGDGLSPGTAWRTLKHALDQKPVFHHNELWVYDITGITESHPGGLALPPTFGNNTLVYDWSAWHVLTYEVTLTAEPLVLNTITAGNIVSQTLDAVTGLATLTTNLSLTPDVYKGKLIKGSGVFEFGRISTHTATTFELTSYSTFTAPITICDPGAEIINSDPFSSAGAFEVSGSSCAFGAFGIKFTNAYTANGICFVVSGQTTAEILGCDFGDCEYSLSLSGGAYAAVDWCYAYTAKVYLDSAFCQYRCSYFRSVSWRLYSSPGVFLYASILDACSPFGGNAGGNNFPLAINVENCLIRSAVASGVYYHGGGHSLVANTRIGGSATDAIIAELPGNLGLVNVQNITALPNTGVGLRILNGCHAQADVATAVSGVAGAYKVGGNAIEDNWAHFGGNEVDPNSFSRLYR